MDLPICRLCSHYTPEERDYGIVPFWLLVHCLSAWVDATECKAGACLVWPMDKGLTPSAGDDKHVGAKSLGLVLIVIVWLSKFFIKTFLLVATKGANKSGASCKLLFD